MKLTGFIVPTGLFLGLFVTPPLCHSYGTAPDESQIQATGEHESMIAEAVAEICKRGDKKLCRDLADFIGILRFGGYMEDEATPTTPTEYYGIPLELEQPGVFTKCTDLSGNAHPYCNHFYFIVGEREREGACGRNATEATKGKCEPGDMYWLSSKVRGNQLYRRALSHLPSTSASPQVQLNEKTQMYYWLGRAAHLLADAGVPGHLISHPINETEVEHRVYEYRASFLVKQDSYARGMNGVGANDLNALFRSLAEETLTIDKTVRAGRHPIKELAGDSPATYWATTGAILFSDSWLLKGADYASRAGGAISGNLGKGPAREQLEKAVQEETKIALELARNIKPRVVAHTVRLFELFWRDKDAAYGYNREMEAAKQRPSVVPRVTFSEDPW